MVRKLKNWLEVARVIQYLKVREKREGGFSLTPELYPDIEDTYYAIRTLRLLNRKANQRKTENYLQNIDWSQVNSPKTIYMLAYLHIRLRQPLKMSFLRKQESRSLRNNWTPAFAGVTNLELLEVPLNLGYPPSLKALLCHDWTGSQTLDAMYFTDEIHKLLHKPVKPFDTLSSLKLHGQENLQALRKKISIFLNHGIGFDEQEIIQWIHSCQNGDGGFGFYPGTTSFMENTYCGLDILLKLKSSPLEINSCKEYILNCQTKSGGFRRAPFEFSIY